MSGATLASPSQQNTTTGRIVLASMVSIAIEFYDFYIYGTAAALGLGRLFFPASDAGAQSVFALDYGM